MFIPIILGTAREGRQSEKVARFVEAFWDIVNWEEVSKRFEDRKIY